MSLLTTLSRRGAAATAPPPQGRAIPGPVVDAAVAAGLVLLVVAGTYGMSVHDHNFRRGFDAGAVALLVACTGVLAWRHRHPVAVLGGVLATLVVYMSLGYAVGPVWLPLIVAYVTAVAAGHRAVGIAVAVGGVALLPWLDHASGSAPAPTLAEITAAAAWVLVLFGTGEALRMRRQRAAELERIREEEALRRSSEERLRIARDLHDVLAHNISVINVQAGVALHVSEDLPAPVRDALTAIRQASRDALGEVRSALDVLRRSGEPAPRDPAPRLAQLEDLVSRARLGGLDVHLDVEGEPRPLEAGADLAAYRIVQEALTNVIRHARAGNAWVRVSYGSNELLVRVEDDGAGAGGVAPAGAAGGSGIAGMRERAAALGGTLAAGPRPGGGFRVEARLPMEEAQ